MATCNQLAVIKTNFFELNYNMGICYKDFLLTKQWSIVNRAQIRKLMSVLVRARKGTGTVPVTVPFTVPLLC